MIQSADLMTSRLCSITSTEWPASTSRWKTFSSTRTSSKCRPVVGSSNRKRVAGGVGRHPVESGVRSAGVRNARSVARVACHDYFRQVPDQLQPLTFAAGKGVDWLAQFQVAQAHFLQQLQALDRALRRTRLGERGQEGDGFLDRRIEEIGDGERAWSVRRGCEHRWTGDRETLDCGLRSYLHFENMGAVAAAIAIGAADEYVAEELHFDLLEPGAAAALALALAGVEAEGAGVEPALLGRLRLGEESADVVERADIDRRVGARRLAENGLVHQHHAAEVLSAAQECGWRSAGCGIAVPVVAVVIGGQAVRGFRLRRDRNGAAR